MPRVERIEYKDAFYHVMNRGRERGRIKLFKTDEDHETFIKTLKETVERFGVILHAYCLMTNHYHLLIQTPKANISRAMRHLNGVYTQRHNGLNHSDGPIFRGRFKSIVVDSDTYLLQLTRYIHLNPIETRKPMVEKLEDYPWSSYPAYINQVKPPDWLSTELTHQMLGAKQRYHGYAKYVAMGNSEPITKFYGRGNIASVIGDKNFSTWFRDEKIPEVKANLKVRQTIAYGLSISEIAKHTAEYFGQTVKAIKQLKKGPSSQSKTRKIAIYLCQELGDHKLKDIGQYFGFSHSGSVSYITSNMRKQVSTENGLKMDVEKVVNYIINNTT
jgi:putative transposase